MIGSKLLTLHGILRFGVWIADVRCCASYVYRIHHEKNLNSAYILSYMDTI